MVLFGENEGKSGRQLLFMRIIELTGIPSIFEWNED
jgi:hypothetical protein